MVINTLQIEPSNGQDNMSLFLIASGLLDLSKGDGFKNNFEIQRANG
jgi:hypothetical protein